MELSHLGVPPARLQAGPMPPGLIAAAVVTVLALGATGCSDRDAGAPSSTTVSGTGAVCDPVRREALDPASARHVLPGAPEPAYTTDPPTSGAHSSARPPTGLLTAPLSRPEQVAVLETGAVLIQYDPDRVDDTGRGRLDGLVGEAVTVAPNPDLPDAVVATAWTVKQVCRAVHTGALERFAAEHRGNDLHE